MSVSVFVFVIVSCVCVFDAWCARACACEFSMPDVRMRVCTHARLCVRVFDAWCAQTRMRVFDAWCAHARLCLCLVFVPVSVSVSVLCLCCAIFVELENCKNVSVSVKPSIWCLTMVFQCIGIPCMWTASFSQKQSLTKMQQSWGTFWIGVNNQWCLTMFFSC